MDLNRDEFENNQHANIESDEPTMGQEVFVDLNVPFEKPAKTFVPGPFYKDVAEVMPELADEETEENTASTQSPRMSGELPIDRRDFMRLFGAGAVAGAAASCVRRPEEKIIPYVDQPVDHIIGVPTNYATTCGECYAACGVMVKTREGRPVKIEGLPDHPISKGSTCALGQSSLQALYHPERRKKPIQTVGGRREEAEWDEVFERLSSRVSKAKRVAIVTNGSTGNRHRFFEEFLTHIGARSEDLYTFEPNGLLTSIAQAHEIAFGVSGLPRADLRLAEVVVGIGSDFLDIGISPVYHAKGYAASHSVRKGAERYGKLIQFESSMTNTGARAHDRYTIAPGSEILIAISLLKALLANPACKGSSQERAEAESIVRSNSKAIEESAASIGASNEDFKNIADELLKRKSIVLCGSTVTHNNSTELQLVGILLNSLVGAYGSTLFFDQGWQKNPVKAGDFKRLKDALPAIDCLFIIDANPLFTVQDSFGLKEAISKVETIISIQSQNTETDSPAHFVLPGRHYLESWGDEESVAGFWSARQPVVRPTTDSRQAEDILLWLSAAMKRPMRYKEYREYVLERWQLVHKMFAANVEFEMFWKSVFRAGFIGQPEKRVLRSASGIAAKISAISAIGDEMLLELPLDIRLHDGRGADRPVLQEVGDAMTTIAWDTWIAINPRTAKKLGLKRNDLLKVETSAGQIEVALFPLPGLHRNTAVIHRGNGRGAGVNKVTDGYGVNPLPLVPAEVDRLSGHPVSAVQQVKISATGKMYRLAAQQKHNDIANRTDIVKKMTFEEAQVAMAKGKDLDTVPDLYPKVKESEMYRWGLSVDLTACNGCSACMVACAVENNVPQIGRQQILKGREMHWIRLDRYFAGPVDNPEVTFQPVMCQHCNHAPCEGVCPVFATAHDPEGFNGMTYNRCVGTRYCANACPYKVRRFNWFTHKWNVIGDSEMDRNLRALNPDVTVRTRGVMEKCSFCIQRVRDAKHKAKERGDAVRDGEIKTACQQVCPTNAITFGNLKDERSQISALRKDGRAFLMLNGDPEHKHYGIKTMPNVNYLAEVTHKPSVINAAKHHGATTGHGEEAKSEGHK